jgi:hypothetical protein
MPIIVDRHIRTDATVLVSSQTRNLTEYVPIKADILRI